jgi:hypothetical protein
MLQGKPSAHALPRARQVHQRVAQLSRTYPKEQRRSRNFDSWYGVKFRTPSFVPDSLLPIPGYICEHPTNAPSLLGPVHGTCDLPETSRVVRHPRPRASSDASHRHSEQHPRASGRSTQIPVYIRPLARSCLLRLRPAYKTSSIRNSSAVASSPNWPPRYPAGAAASAHPANSTHHVQPSER